MEVWSRSSAPRGTSIVQPRPCQTGAEICGIFQVRNVFESEYTALHSKYVRATELIRGVGSSKECSWFFPNSRANSSSKHLYYTPFDSAVQKWLNESKGLRDRERYEIFISSRNCAVLGPTLLTLWNLYNPRCHTMVLVLCRQKKTWNVWLWRTKNYELI